MRMVITPIQQQFVNPVTHVANQPPVRDRHPHLSIEGRTQQPSAELEANRAFMTAVRDFGVAITSAVAEILSNTQSIFDTMVGTSSHADAMTVYPNGYENDYEYENGSESRYESGYRNGYRNGYNGRNGYANGNGNVSGYTNGNGNAASVRVYQLAASQQNTSAPMPAAEQSRANPGRNDFTIERNGRSHSFSVNVSETASNRTVQQRVANAVNERPIGIQANVQSDDLGRSSLVLTAVSTGEGNAFTIADVPNEGTVIEALNADIVTREAQDAMYTVNGEERTAPTNTVDLNESIRATLQYAAPEEEIVVTTERDVQGIAEAISELVEGFNEMRQSAVTYAQYNEQDGGADALRRRLDNIYYDNVTSLESIGVTRGEENRLNVDTDRLTAAVENGRAEEELTDSFGFTGQLSRLGDVLADDPATFGMRIAMSVL